MVTGCATVTLPPAGIRDGQEEISLGWKDMVKAALKDNPEILAARAAVKSTVHARNIAAGDYLPEARGSLDRTRTDGPSSRPEDGLGLGISASQNLFSGFETTGKTLKAQKQWAAAKSAYRETSADVRFRLRSAYVELLKQRALLEVNRKIAERRRQNAELIKLRYDAGREHIGSSLRADAIVEQALFELRQTGRRMETQSLTAGKEMGAGFVRDLRVDGDLESSRIILPDEPPDYEVLAESTPRVRKLIELAEAAKAEVISAQSVVWPSVDGTYDYGYSGEKAALLGKETRLGLSVSVPFFNGGENIQGILKARADYAAALEAARSARDEAITGLSSAWVAFKDAEEQVGVRRKFLEASRKRSEIVRAQYSSGLSDFQEFDIAEQDLADSETAYVQSLAEAQIQDANWQLAKGETLEDET